MPEPDEPTPIEPTGGTAPPPIEPGSAAAPPPIEPTGTAAPPPPVEPEARAPKTEPARPAAPPAAYVPLLAHPNVPPLKPASAQGRAYDLPTGRHVVSAGLQLALASTRDLRRASIYIGLLALGALGPVVVFLLVTVTRMGDEAQVLFDQFATDPTVALLSRPELVGIILVAELITGLGFIVLWAVATDAQGMAIAMLGGRAADRPLRLFEALQRARQVFWRLLGAGTIVGVASAAVQAIVSAILGSVSRSEIASLTIAPVVATIAITPLAYTSTAIVLGDVGAVESVRRSWRLFRARPSIALIVVLFTLVTDAIQLFALLGGLDLVIRAGELLHISFTSGIVAAAAGLGLILASIVALGSLLFTILAIVSAPQVTAFLGLTYYSAGLDRARVDGPRPRSLRWVTLPMLGAMALLAALAVLVQPSVESTAFDDPISAFTGLRALDHHQVTYTDGDIDRVDDPEGDLVGAAEPGADIVLVEYASLALVPDWMLDETFDCDAPEVACQSGADRPGAFDDGALLYLTRLAAPITTIAGDGFRAGRVLEASVIFALEDERTAPRAPGQPYSSASDYIVTRFGPNPTIEARSLGIEGFAIDEIGARSTWVDNDIWTLIPVRSMRSYPLRWDVATTIRAADAITSRDSVRPIDGGSLRAFEANASIVFEAVPTFVP